MRLSIVSLILFTGAFSNPSLAQSAPFVRTIASHVAVFEQVRFKLQCPAGYIPTGYSLTPQNPYYYYTNSDVGTRDLIDSSNAPINRNTLSSAAQLDGGGYAVFLLNSNATHQHDLEVLVTCLTAAATTDNALTLVKATVSAASKSIGTAMSFCPPDSPVALGGFSNADTVLLQDTGSAPVWGTSSNPVLLGDVADGQTGPPTGWQMTVLNTNSAAAGIIAYSICGKAPALQTFIYSVAVPQASFGVKTPF